MKRLTKKQRTVAETLCQLIENEGIAKEVIKDGFVVIDDFHFYLTRAMVMAGYSNRTIEKYAFDHEMPEQLYIFNHESRLSIWISLMLLHPENASYHIVLTLSGMFILVSSTQPQNVATLIISIPSGI